jgi:hypothetical protein
MSVAFNLLGEAFANNIIQSAKQHKEVGFFNSIFITKFFPMSKIPQKAAL